jgi:hypothetical protein
MLPYAPALDVRMWELMVTAPPEADYLMVFIEEFRSIAHNNVCCSDALHADLLTMLCSSANPL